MTDEQARAAFEDWWLGVANTMDVKGWPIKADAELGFLAGYAAAAQERAPAELLGRVANWLELIGEQHAEWQGIGSTVAELRQYAAQQQPASRASDER